jgi:hypothetical protein
MDVLLRLLYVERTEVNVAPRSPGVRRITVERDSELATPSDVDSRRRTEPKEAL